MNKLTEYTDCAECGVIAEILDRIVLESTSGPVEHIKTWCARGHVLLHPVEL